MYTGEIKVDLNLKAAKLVSYGNQFKNDRKMTQVVDKCSITQDYGRLIKVVLQNG